MSRDFSAINSLISSDLLVTDGMFNKAQFNDFLVVMVCVIVSYMINTCANSLSHTVDAFLFCPVTTLCFMGTSTFSTSWRFPFNFSGHFFFFCCDHVFDNSGIL